MRRNPFRRHSRPRTLPHAAIGKDTVVVAFVRNDGSKVTASGEPFIQLIVDSHHRYHPSALIDVTPAAAFDLARQLLLAAQDDAMCELGSVHEDIDRCVRCGGRHVQRPIQ